MKDAADMIKNSEEKVRLRERMPLFITIAAVFLLLVIATFVIVNTINSSIYSERKEYLEEITKASAMTVNESVRNQKEEAEIIKAVVESQLSAADDAGDYILDLPKRLGKEDDRLFIVDSGGNYYCSDGHEGRITDRTYYTDKTDREVEYISTLPHLSRDKTYLIYRFRLEKPVRAMSDGQEIEVMYFGLMHDLDALNRTVSSLFEGANNTFIYEKDTGTMLYKQFGLGMLLQGYVLYPKLREVRLINEEDPEELISDCRNDEQVVVEFEQKGKNYYFCSTPIEAQEWALSFVIQSDYISSASGSSFNNVIVSILVFAFFLSVAIVIVALMTMRIRSSRRERETLEQVSAAKSNFLFNMSHDIRTPMNAIIGFTGIAMKNIGDRKRVMDSLKKIQLSGNLLLALINDILEFSRIESGNVKLNAVECSIAGIFESVETVLSDMAEEKNIDLYFREENISSRFVLIDETRCQRLLINVISNGIKYTPEGGWVKVCMEQIGNDAEGMGTYRFTVEDNGIGMSEEFQKHLFEEFTREENSTTSGIQGTGLGLALCKAITDLMGGTIECVSKQNEGTTFTIDLPLQILDEIEVEAEAHGDSAGEIVLEGSRILLVEDNELNREIASEILEEVGIAVHEAENGQVAVEIITEKGIDFFDFILMDIQMPVMNGYEAAAEIRRLFPDSDIPVIALSANAFEEDRQQSRASGMTDHIAKPIDVEKLYGVLRKHKRNGGTA